MIAHGKDIKIFAGNSNRVLAQEICQHLNTKLGDSEVGKFADGECYASLYESVRGSDVFVIQSTCNPVNDNLMEMLVMIDALKRASAGRITAVIPYFGYARQDRKAKARPDFGKAGGQYDRGGRRRSRVDYGSACCADSGLFRYSCGQPAGQSYFRGLLRRAVRRAGRGDGGRFSGRRFRVPRPRFLPRNWA